MARFTESIVEEAALTWLEGLGWAVKHGPEIAPEELAAERRDFGRVVLEQRLQDALARLRGQGRDRFSGHRGDHRSRFDEG